MALALRPCFGPSPQQLVSAFNLTRLEVLIVRDGNGETMERKRERKRLFFGAVDILESHSGADKT